MVWDWLNLIGIIAFTSSGAIVAREEKYDFLGVLIFGHKSMNIFINYTQNKNVSSLIESLSTGKF